MSNALSNPLTDEEIEFLDSFLLERFDDDDEALGRDEGVVCLSELDGFLTAIVSGPTTVMPSEWLPAVWGEFPPLYEDLEEAHRIMSLLVRHMNGIAVHLIEDPESFEPIFLSSERDKKTVLVVDEWCEGFMRGVELSKDAWIAGGTTIKEHLVNILAFCEIGGWIGYDSDDFAELERRQLAIAPSVRAIHAYWLARREPGVLVQDAEIPFGFPNSQVGRNDPCPCGSGKKYKRCCLQ
jgi:uncharacterized protein